MTTIVEEKKFLFIIAKQRSGTTLLRRGLATTQYFFDLNEIFHPSAKGLYWDFFKEQAKNNLDLIVPSQDNQNYIMNSFLKTKKEEVDNIKSNAIILVDIKYNSTCNNNFAWHSPLEVPYLLKYIKNQQIKVIHLIRKNIFKSYLSEQYALKTHIWHIDSDSQKENQRLKIKILPNKMLEEIEFRRKEIVFFQEELAKLNITHCEIFYEDLLSDKGDAFSEITIKQVKNILGDMSMNLNPSIITKKVVNKSSQEIIVNYKEVYEALRSIKEEKWLDEN